jgi:PAS domain S-box-containing protein
MERVVGFCPRRFLYSPEYVKKRFTKKERDLQYVEEPMIQQTPYTDMFVILSTISIIVGLYMLQRFHQPEAAVGMFIIMASVQWTLISLLQLGSVDLAAKLFWNKIKYVGLVTMPPAWLVFTLYYTGREKWVTARNGALLSIIPAATLGLTFTNGAHRLIWTDSVLKEGELIVVHHTYGMWFWVNMVYTYSLIFLGSFLLIEMLSRYRSIFRWQRGALLACALLPPLWSLLYVFRVTLYPYLESTPLNLPVTNVGILAVLLYVKSVNIVPVAREAIIDSMSDSVIVLDSKNRIIDMNPSAQTLTGFTGNFAGQPVGTVWPLWSEQMNVNHWTNQDREIVADHHGEQRTYDVRTSSLAGWQGDPVCRVIVIRDITERKRAEEEIKKFKTISDRAGYGSVIFDGNGTIIYINKSFAEMHQYTVRDVLGKNQSIFFNKDQMEEVNTLCEQLTKEGSYIGKEVWHTRRDGSVFPTLMNGTLIEDGNGTPLFMTATAIDITERKEAEEKLKTSLREKEVLLREIHHRVKNNLQIISSLLSLQSDYSGGERDSKILKENQNRIRTMALIHEKLYQCEDMANINVKEYIEAVAYGLFCSYEINTERIALTVDVGPVSLGIDTAIPCGLIINELLSNCLNHAFPGNRKGCIKITLGSLDGVIELVVKDDGVGIPEDIDFKNTDSLGLHLVTILSEEQLDGEIRLTRNTGTEFRITFKEVS